MYLDVFTARNKFILVGILRHEEWEIIMIYSMSRKAVSLKTTYIILYALTIFIILRHILYYCFKSKIFVCEVTITALLLLLLWSRGSRQNNIVLVIGIRSMHHQPQSTFNITFIVPTELQSQMHVLLTFLLAIFVIEYLQYESQILRHGSLT